MKNHVLFVATAALALSACQQAGNTTSETPAAANNATAPAEPAANETAAAAPAGSAAFTAGQAPSKDFMVGTWGEGDACEMAIQFEAGGKIKDGPFEKWDLQDGNLTMEGAPQKMKLTVVDEKTMESQLEGQDKKRTLKRCG
jgi:pyruvate/2-oxoglutarate dehydrogenase complex dihydrolipoamide acyltransferase (E2) component